MLGAMDRRRQDPHPHRTVWRALMCLTAWPAASQGAGPPPTLTVQVGKAAPMVFAAIPGGRFLMGSPPGEGYAQEHPAHEVEVAPFYMATCEVTVAQWSEVMGGAWAVRPNANPNDPADKVSWCAALHFANQLSVREPGAEPVYALEGCERDTEPRWDRTRQGFRLPTEAEWEYAARAGTRTPWWTGGDPASLSDAAWVAERGNAGVHEVGRKRANPWGLYDVHGSVWEWAWDAWVPYDGSAPADPGQRVVRGGAAWFVADMARSAFRYPCPRTQAAAGYGLRLVLDAGATRAGAAR